MKEIEMIATFDDKGIPKPFRFRLESEDESLLVVSIDRILYSELSRKGDTIKFRCTCIINDINKTLDIYYYKMEMKWYLDM